MNPSNKSVDVIIPAYNSLHWLEQTVDSVLRQTHHNFQLYIVDDGSNDGTGQWALSIRDQRVHYIKKGNGGASSARNLGIHSSASEFIALLDADDIWREDKLEKQLELICADENIGMVYGHHYVIDENNVIVGNLRITERGNLFNKLVNGNTIAGSASMVLIRRSIMEKAGDFKEDLVNGEDWLMWLKISKLCRIDVVPEMIASIRVHPASAQRQDEKMADALVQAYPIMKAELELTQSQQRLLASYCLYNPMVTYENLGNHAKARTTMMYLFQENPPAKMDWIRSGIHISVGIYNRIILSHPVFTPLKVFWRVVKQCLRLIRRVILYPIRQFVHFLKRCYHYLKRKLHIKYG